MALPSEWNPQLYIGDTYEVSFELFDDEDETQQTDMTGYTPRLQLRQRKADASVVADWSAYFTSTAASGVFDLSVPPAVTADLDPGSYYVDFELHNANSSDVRTYAAGVLTATRDVTR